MKEIAFQKWEATGNDFFFVDFETQDIPASTFQPHLVQALCKRENGKGADGVVLYSNCIGQTVQMTIINSDGSSGDMCGNALRCLAEILYHRDKQPKHFVQLAERTVEVHCRKAGDSCVLMGEARAQLNRPLFQNLPELDAVLGGEGYLLSFGNPHYVLVVKEIPQDWELKGQACQLPADTLMGTGGINCGFVTELADANGHFQLRVFERGAGATKSCGSGACAASAVLEQIQKLPPPHHLALTGGVLSIAREDRGFVLQGSACKEYDGVWNFEL